ncbi:glycosyltransferase family 2 protein [Hymenobacter aerophilus]|uniref:glycosyltransferase family 2 protein n=1 Tax=Hymenobacter aerophilus TaxID=119644 RepID=UPI0003649DF1|nr:glycosyltransferase family 2 protein [Hymenobacter aerophilus]
MKIFAISVVKNEADIVKYNLLEASKWAHKIFVLDNGSTDGTWEIVNSIKSDKIIPWKTENKGFYDGIRGEVYNEFKHLASEGDWWCFRLDADEFYADNPVEFLAKVSPIYHFVATATIHFWITKEDIAEYDFDDDAENNIRNIRYYEKYTWSEARFFRHRPKMIWTLGAELPKHMGVLCPTRIRVKHYQFRSMAQIQNRITTRIEAVKNGFKGWNHSINEDATSYLSKRADLHKYEGGNVWNILGSHNKYYQRKYDIVLKVILHWLGFYK